MQDPTNTLELASSEVLKDGNLAQNFVQLVFLLAAAAEEITPEGVLGHSQIVPVANFEYPFVTADGVANAETPS